MEYKNYFLVNGQDKKNIEKYAENIDCIVANANIAIHNKKSLINSIQNYNLDFIIDPMTYMLQADPKVILKDGKLKSSLAKVLKQIYKIDPSNMDFNGGKAIINYLKEDNQYLNVFLENVYDFQRNYQKEIQEDLGAFSTIDVGIKIYSSPYFDMTDKDYLKFNKLILKEGKQFQLFRIIISNKTNLDFVEELILEINNSEMKFIEIWIDADRKNEISNILHILNGIKNKKLLFKFISFAEIYKIHSSMQEISSIEGFITAFGYGESRNVYPIGGGIPVNKIYSTWQRKRIYVTDFFKEIEDAGINLDDESNQTLYLQEVCNCSVCQDVLEKNGIVGLKLYAEYSEYDRKLKNGLTSKRIKASQKAITLTNYHYIEIKLDEYKDFFSKNGFKNKRYERYIKNTIS